MSFNAKESLVQQAQLEVQELHLPFTITGSATAASVVFKATHPAILFAKTEGVDQITAALASGDTAPTYAAQSNLGGDFSILVDIGEKLAKVVSCEVSVLSSEKDVSNALLPSAPADGIVAGGARDKIALDVKNAPAFNSAVTVVGCVHVKYIVAK